MGRSDYHAGGKSVVLVEVELAGDQAATFVYKPRNIDAEGAFQPLLRRLTEDGVIPFATYKVLCKGDYGYAELIPSGRNHAADESTIQRLYRQLGGYLALFYILGGADLHFENILIADGDAFICDCETVLSVVFPGMEIPLRSFGDSVYRTGMLEWPRAGAAGTDAEMRLSGYSGGESYELPFAVPRINDLRASLGVRVQFLTGVKVEQTAPNRIFFEGRVVDPAGYKSCILDGFNRVYGWFERQPGTASRFVADLLESAWIRFVNWGTQAYTHLLVAARHPKCLSEPLEVDLIFNTLRLHRRIWDVTGELLGCELAAMWRLDVPIFTAAANGRTLWADHRNELSMDLALSPLENAAGRIEGLSSDERIRQNQYIGAGLSPAEIHSPDFVAAAVNYAVQIGRRLCELMRPESEAGPWTTYELTPDGTYKIGVGSDLYHGAAGIGFFLAYLDAIAPHPEFRAAAPARRGLLPPPSRAGADRRVRGIGRDRLPADPRRRALGRPVALRPGLPDHRPDRAAHRLGSPVRRAERGRRRHPRRAGPRRGRRRLGLRRRPAVRRSPPGIRRPERRCAELGDRAAGPCHRQSHRLRARHGRHRMVADRRGLGRTPRGFD